MDNIELLGYLIVAVTFFGTLIVSWEWVAHSTMEDKYVKLFFLTLVVSGVACAIFAAWPFFYTDLRLEYLGAGKSDEPAAWLDSVAISDRAEAMELYNSRFGVGWPVTAFFWYILVGLPFSAVFVVIAKLGNYVYKRNSKHT